MSGEASVVPDWLPNWLEPADYADLKDASLQRLAWEFLRRNPEYQRDWQELGSLFDADSSRCDHSLKYEGVRLAERWGISDMVDPASWCIPRVCTAVVEFRHRRSRVAEFELQAHQHMVIFDERTPEREVVRAIRAQLRTRPNTIRSTRVHRRDLITLLRILDADAAGAPNKEIIRVLLERHVGEPRATLRDKRKAAHRYRNTDYRLLAVRDAVKMTVWDRPRRREK